MEEKNRFPLHCKVQGNPCPREAFQILSYFLFCGRIQAYDFSFLFSFCSQYFSTISVKAVNMQTSHIPLEIWLHSCSLFPMLHSLCYAASLAIERTSFEFGAELGTIKLQLYLLTIFCISIHLLKSQSNLRVQVQKEFQLQWQTRKPLHAFLNSSILKLRSKVMYLYKF